MREAPVDRELLRSIIERNLERQATATSQPGSTRDRGRCR
jgi:hypothetical protein